MADYLPHSISELHFLIPGMQHIHSLRDSCHPSVMLQEPNLNKTNEMHSSNMIKAVLFWTKIDLVQLSISRELPGITGDCIKRAQGMEIKRSSLQGANTSRIASGCMLRSARSHNWQGKCYICFVCPSGCVFSCPMTGCFVQRKFRLLACQLVYCLLFSFSWIYNPPCEVHTT